MEPRIAVDPELLKLVSKLDHFRGLWVAGVGLPPERLLALRRVARMQSVASSCRIAGNKASEGEVASLLSGETPATMEAAELLGYATAIDRRFPFHGPLVTFDEVAELNAIVNGKSGTLVPPSPLRDTPIHLEVFDAEGRALGRVLQTLPPRLLQDKVDTLLSWLEIELRRGEQHALLVIGVFFLYLTGISPFEEGNGRTARVMIPHLLRRSGYSFVDCSSWERVLDEQRLAYYDAIDAAETKMWTDEADVGPWVRFYLESLHTLAVRLQSKMDIETRARELPPLQRAILETIREHGSGAAALLMAATGANRNTLKDNLRRLVDRGLLERIGSKRGTFYRLAGADVPREQ